MIKFTFNDGGRHKAGYKGTTGDCVTRAISIVTGLPYQKVYDDLNLLAEPFNNKKVSKNRKVSNSRTGVNRQVYDKYLKSLGMKWIPTMFIGQGCKVHLKADELPHGKIICRLSKHLTAVIDGVVNDIYNPAREVHCTEFINGIQSSHIEERCVYGYYTFE